MPDDSLADGVITSLVAFKDGHDQLEQVLLVNPAFFHSVYFL